LAELKAALRAVKTAVVSVGCSQAA